MKTDCTVCDGKGNFPDISDCCGAKRDPDVGLCYDCHDHSEPMECAECNGTGQVEDDYYDDDEYYGNIP